MSILQDCLAAITPVDEQARAAAEARQPRLTKPAGALGELETLGNQLSAISGQCPPPVPERALVCVFAADHGVQAQRVSPWPQEVTVQMAANIVGGGAGINVLARSAGADVATIDVGMLTPVAGCRDERVAPGTADFTAGPAMTAEQAIAAVEVGIRTARRAVANGYRALVPGEVGIGNTTPAAALVCAMTGALPQEVAGRGAGADDTMLAHKIDVIRIGLERHGLATGQGAQDPLRTLACVGGFEHAAVVGLLLGAAEARVPVVLDGVIACSAALVAVALEPKVRGYLVAGHDGAEPAIRCATSSLGLRPLLSLGLRLGEGTGGALALPIVAAAARVLGEMATFDDAGVTEEHA